MRVLCYSLFALITPVAVASAQSYADTERVTAIDLAVELRSISRQAGPVRRAPPSLGAKDLEIRVDGRQQPIVAVAPVAASGGKPYQILVYLDTELSDSRELGATLGLLIPRALQLTEIASVDLVVADPLPRFVLRDVDDPELLQSLLASADWKEAAGDRLRALRAGFGEALADTESEFDLEDLQNAFLSEERRVVEERLDLLLSFLADQRGGAAQRALILIGMQFDLEPRTFYSSWAEVSKPLPPLAPEPGSGLGEGARQVAAAMAAYGWITYPVAAPARESPLIPGLRIGKWRLAGPAGGRILGIRITRESERNPELARGYLEKGRALSAAGQPAEAEEAFRQALHHFYGDPRTAPEQAEALVGLAEALKKQGLEDEARAAIALASETDPSAVATEPAALATLLDPDMPLSILAEETSGRVLRVEEDVESGLADLQRRIRLTFQLPGDPRGAIYPVEARIARDGWSLRGPRWVRFGTPPRVAIARSRLLVAADLAEPTLTLDGRVARRSGGADPTSFRLELSAPGGDVQSRLGEARDCRITAAWLTDDEIVGSEQTAVECGLTNGALTVNAEMESPAEAELAAIVVEHLASEEWGSEILVIDSSTN